MTAKKNKNNGKVAAKMNFELKRIEPLTDNQQKVFESRDDHQLLYGVAGTGKTFLSMYLALDDIVNREYYSKFYIVRSVVSSRNMGFLPGNEKEKAAVYEEPYNAACSELFGRGDAYGYLKQKGVIEFKTTSFIRGITLDNCVVFVDEFQNMTAHELNSVITRVGKNCRLILSGDCRQDDLQQHREKSGAWDTMQIVKRMDSFRCVEFGFDDIVRSDFVKEYIIARYKLEQQGVVQSL